MGIRAFFKPEGTPPLGGGVQPGTLAGASQQPLGQPPDPPPLGGGSLQPPEGGQTVAEFFLTEVVRKGKNGLETGP